MAGDRDLFVLEHWTDWWTIERLGATSVEGTSEEMHGIAGAIRSRGTFAAKRCAVDATGPVVELWSPRNSINPYQITIAAADALATAIETEVVPMADRVTEEVSRGGR